MDNWTYITMFDRPYSADKQAEGQSVSWAVATGACCGCKHLPRCEIDSRFIPPETAACMRKKAELLKRKENTDD